MEEYKKDCETKKEHGPMGGPGGPKGQRGPMGGPGGPMGMPPMMGQPMMYMPVMMWMPVMPMQPMMPPMDGPAGRSGGPMEGFGKKPGRPPFVDKIEELEKKVAELEARLAEKE